MSWGGLFNKGEGEKHDCRFVWNETGHEHGAKELEKLLHNFHVVEVSVPQKFHHFLDRYDNESRWFGIVSKAGGFMLPRKQAEQLMQNPENGDIVRCCGNREIVEKVVEGIEALVKEVGEEGR